MPFSAFRPLADAGILLAALVTQGCGGGESSAGIPAPLPTPVAAATVKVSPAASALIVGDSVRLSAAVTDASGLPLSRVVTWSTSDAMIAIVSASGVATALRAGSATITATVESKSGSALLTIEAPKPPATVTSLRFDRPAATIALRGAFSLGVIARDSTGAAVTKPAIAWTTSNAAVATVNTAGVITANQVGVATITGTVDGQASTAEVTVMAFSAISAGYAETCAISQSGKLYCAGIREGARAKLVAPDLRFTSVFGSTRLHDITCAIAADQSLYCWGDNQAGELGVGDTTARNVPTLVRGGLKFRSVSMGQGITGGLLINGVQVPAVIAHHTCGLTVAGAAYCWGDGSVGQLGAGGVASATTPSAVAGGFRFSEITSGRLYSCGIADDARTFCWGDNTAGHIGVGGWSNTPYVVPTLVSGTTTLAHIAGGGSTCGVTADSSAYCWGDNTLGKTGSTAIETCFGGKLCTTVPTRIATNTRLGAIASAEYASCGLSGGGTVYCWGMNIDDKFGASISGCSTANATAPCTPIPTAGPAGFVTLTASPFTMCGMRSDGGAYCWGGNEFGQLGAPGLSGSRAPTAFTIDPDSRP